MLISLDSIVLSLILASCVGSRSARTSFSEQNEPFDPLSSSAKTFIIGESIIQPSTTARNLGVIFDQHLDMEAHVNALCKSCYGHLRRIGHIRKYLTTEATQLLVHSFVTSRLDNGNSLLYGLPDTLLAKLQLVQNTAARIVSRTRPCDHITPVLQKLHWLPVKQRVSFKILTLTHKAIHGLAPEYISELLHHYQPQRTLRSSSQLLLEVPRTRLTNYGRRSFSHAAPTLWNDLPVSLRNIETLGAFKSNLKTYLFRTAYP